MSHSLKKITKRAVRRIVLQPSFGKAFLLIFWPICRLLQKATNFCWGAFDRLPGALPFKKKKYEKPNFDIVRTYYKSLKARCQDMPLKPKISVLVPVYKVKPEYFWEALKSVAVQVYDNWELCIVDDCSNDPRLVEIVEEFQRAYPGKVKFKIHQQNGHISVTSNSCLELATGDYIALLDHDDRLYPNALAEMVRFINLNQEPDILYSDERTVDATGEALWDTYFKPDWSPFMHLCMNYTTHLSVYRLRLVREIGGFRKGFEGSQDHDLMLRMVEATKKPVVHVPLCLYQWRAHPESTALSVSAKPYAALAGEKAVSEHLLRRGRPAKVSWEPHTAHYRLNFELPIAKPLISLLIPTRNKFELISKCLLSVFERSTYQNFEVIILDNESSDPECFALYSQFAHKYTDRVFVEKVAGAFNFARSNNIGAAVARGEYLVLLNNDTEVLEPKWLEEMLMVCQFPEVGAVGAKLMYPDGKVQHAGVMLTDRSIAQHIGIGAPKEHALYCNAINTLREVAAVKAACMMVRKSVWKELDGLVEIWVPNGYGDVDFCLRLSEKKYSCLFTPYAELIHHESPSRKATLEHFERQYIIKKYGGKLMNDPYLNPNLQRVTNYAIDSNNMNYELRAVEFRELLDNPELI